MTTPARFTMADVTRAVRAAEKAGLCVAGFKITDDGSILVLTPDSGVANDAAPNPLDRLHRHG